MGMSRESSRRGERGDDRRGDRAPLGVDGGSFGCKEVGASHGRSGATQSAITAVEECFQPWEAVEAAWQEEQREAAKVLLDLQQARTEGALGKTSDELTAVAQQFGVESASQLWRKLYDRATGVWSYWNDRLNGHVNRVSLCFRVTCL
ncbi:unnamed protein product [Gongylonema pulchrum]|uniref:DUF4780 domain-containing protein n=1 Tax=Gongylonema pulchrum TaxID=637853 RepID=A0A183EH19_9BILA|nr:unnamed protein product [Gongylonema pulchrum]